MVTALPTRIDGFRWSDGLLAEGSPLLANPPSSRAPARFRRLSRRPYQECDRRRPVVLGDGQEILVRAAVRPYKQNGFVRNAHLLTLVLFAFVAFLPWWREMYWAGMSVFGWLMALLMLFSPAIALLVFRLERRAGGPPKE